MSTYSKADYDTSQWREITAKVIEQYKRTCQVCGGFFGPANIAHHVHYRDGVLSQQACVAVCEICHGNLHRHSPYCEACGEMFWRWFFASTYYPKYDDGTGYWEYCESREEPRLCDDCAEPLLKDERACFKKGFFPAFRRHAPKPDLRVSDASPCAESREVYLETTMIKTLPRDLPLAATRAHLARLLRTTTATLERAELLGLLRTHRTGGNVIIFREDVLEYLKNRQGGTKNVAAN